MEELVAGVSELFVDGELSENYKYAVMCTLAGCRLDGEGTE